jgi:hypothetical protein
VRPYLKEQAGHGARHMLLVVSFVLIFVVALVIFQIGYPIFFPGASLRL